MLLTFYCTKFDRSKKCNSCKGMYTRARDTAGTGMCTTVLMEASGDITELKIFTVQMMKIIEAFPELNAPRCDDQVKLFRKKLVAYLPISLKFRLNEKKDIV